MKYVLAALMALVILAASVSAVDMVITPNIVGMAETDIQEVQVCVYRADKSPYVGLDLVLGSVCQDTNGDEACGPTDLDTDGKFTAVVKSSPTDANGCGIVELETKGVTGGDFVYQVNGYFAEVFVNMEGGLAYVPEFGILASAAVLGLAGLFIYKKRG